MMLNKWAKQWCKDNDLTIKDKQTAQWVYRMMDWFAMYTLNQSKIQVHPKGNTFFLGGTCYVTVTSEKYLCSNGDIKKSIRFTDQSGVTAWVAPEKDLP